MRKPVYTGAMHAPAAPRKTRDRDLARWIWRDHIVRWWPWLGLALVCMVLDGAMAGALSLMMRPMFDDVLVARRQDMVLWVALGVAGIFLVRALASLIFRAVLAYVGDKVITGLQTRLAAHLLTLDQQFHHNHPPGHLIERVRGDTQELSILFDRILLAGVRDIVSVVSLIAAALYIDWTWTLVALIGVPLLILPAALLQRLVRRMGMRARTAAADASTRLDEIFHGVGTIQRNGLEHHETNRLARVLALYVKARLRTASGQAAMGSLSDVVAALGFALVLILAGSQIIAGTRTVGEFMAFFAAIALLFEPMRRLGALSGAWQTVLASLERIDTLLAYRPSVTQPQGPLALPPARGAETIRFDDVTFAYGTDPVLRGLSFTAEAGKTTALVGPSGAGKSTVFTLLTRLADPQSGRITLGGQDISRMDLRALRDLFAVVAQDSALFDETLRDNILMGAADVSPERLDAAVRDAHVAEFLPQMPQGLDTRAGPRGSALSGGQRQRIAIARALVRDAQILLLDEATSALDAQSEALIQLALDRLGPGRTTLVIAHRLATIRHAHRILVLDAGRVVESGTHAELLSRGGIYARLHALQADDTA